MKIECGFFLELNRIDWVLKFVVKVKHGFKEQILWQPLHGRISRFVFHGTFWQADFNCFSRSHLQSLWRLHLIKKENHSIFKERLIKVQHANNEPFLVTNMPGHLKNSEKIGISE